MSGFHIPSVFVRLSGVLREGRQVLSRHAVRDGLSDQLILLAVTYTRSFEARMGSLVARWRAGKLVVRPRKPSPKKPPLPPSETDLPKDKPLRMPRGFGWLSKRIRPDGFSTAAQLCEVIADPEMAALIAAGPQAGRLLRPLCHMYGVKLDAIARPKPARPKPAPTAAQLAWRAERAEAKRQRELSKTSSRKSVVPPGHTFPTTEQGWAIWNRRNKRNERDRKAAKRKST